MQRSIMDILNHSDISITKRYIGVNQDSKDQLMKGLSFQKRDEPFSLYLLHIESKVKH